MNANQATALAATANKHEKGLEAAFRELLTDLKNRELITEKKFNDWLALAGIAPPEATSTPTQTA